MSSSGLARVAGGLVLFLGLAGAGPWADLPDDPASARQVVLQEVLPQLEARRLAATARAKAAEDVAAGELPLGAAIQSLDAATASSPAVIDARRYALDEAAQERARDQRDALPDLGSSRTERAAERAWARAVEAEEAAEAAERRLLLSLRAWLEDHPEWTATQLAPRRAGVDLAFFQAEQAADPEDADSLAWLGQLDDARQRWDAVAAQLRWRAVAPSVAPPDPTPELAALEADERVLAPDAAERLVLMLPELTDDDRTRAEEALVAWYRGPATLRREAELAGVPAETPGNVDMAEAAYVAAQGEVSEVDGPVGEAQRVVHALDVAIAQARVERARAAVEKQAAAQAADAAAEAARRAEEARRADPNEHPAVAMLQASASWTEAATEAVATAQGELDTAAKDRADRLAALRTEVGVLLGDLPRTALESQPSADASYLRLRSLVDTIRQQVMAGPPRIGTRLADLPTLPPHDERVAQLDTWVGENAVEADADKRERVAELLDATRRALAAEIDVRANASAAGEAAWQQLLLDLRTAKSLKHDLAGEISAGAARAERAVFLRDVAAEMRLLGLQILALIRERFVWLLAVPGRLLDLDWMLERLSGGLTTLLVLAGWIVARRRARELVERVFDAVHSWWMPLTDEAREQLAPDAQTVLRRIVDVVVLWLVSGSAEMLAPELGIAVRGAAVASAFAVLRAATPLWLATPDESHPALLVVDGKTISLVQRSWMLLGVWWVTGWVLDRVLADLFFADAIASVVSWIVWIVGIVLILVLLVWWDPKLVRRVRRLTRLPGWLDVWLSRESVGVLAPVRAVVLAAYLLAAAVWDVAQGRAAQRDGYSALVAVMDRVRFGGDTNGGEVGTPLSDELMAKLCEGEVDTDVALPRKKVEEALVGHLEGWMKERRRGVLVLTGDRGDGKGVFLERVAPLLRVDGRAPTTLSLDRRLRGRAAGLQWLADALNLPFDGDANALVAAVKERPAQAIVVRRAQRAFLRDVGGFDALEAILYVCSATSDRHVWILTFHRPAWRYLMRVGTLVNTGVARAVLDLAPLSGPEMRELILRRTAAVGLEVDFRRLENTGPFGAPPEVEAERAVQSYFRLLAEASGGCPGVALRLWARSLRLRSDGVADAVVIPELAADAAGPLADDEVFVLAALRIQDAMTAPELSMVLHQEEDDVRSVLRELVQAGILVDLEDEQVGIATLQVKPVSRTLRRRNVLPWLA